VKNFANKFKVLISVFAFILVAAVSGVLINNAKTEVPLFCSVSGETFVETENLDNSELFSVYAENTLYSKNTINTINPARNRLDEHSAQVYDYLQDKIELVADGELENTTFVIDQQTLESWGVKTTWTNSELSVGSITDFNPVGNRFMAQFDLSKIMVALLNDCPYHLYWFDKTIGIAHAYNGHIAGNRASATVENLVMAFKVAEEYQPSSYESGSPTVDTTKTSAVVSTKTTALSIVENHASLSDYEKLMAYKDEIIALVSYNNEAADEDYEGGYGNPWQIIYVFDGDPQTNVVCEGYAKAFEYLCDLTDFRSNSVECHLVSGFMQGTSNNGAHMWNVVTMNDGKNYLIDVTNSESTSVGKNGELILAHAAGGSIASGYTFSCAGSNVVYTYDEGTKSLWGTESSSVLAISLEPYDHEAHTISITLASNIVYDKNPVTVGLANSTGYDIYYSLDGDASNYDITYEFFISNGGAIGDKLAAAPVNVGSYFVKFTATNKYDDTITVENTKLFEIRKANTSATVTVSSVTAAGTTIGDVTLSAIATGILGEEVEGSVYFVDNSNNPLPASTIISQGMYYKWLFVPSSNNYKTVTGNKILWFHSFTVTVTVDDVTHGSVVGGGTFHDDDEVVVRAVPADGYKFVGWMENDVIVSTSLEYTIQIHEDHSLVAVFEKDTTISFTFDSIVEIMWYVFYGLCGIAIFSCLVILFSKKETKGTKEE